MIEEEPRDDRVGVKIDRYPDPPALVDDLQQWRKGTRLIELANKGETPHTKHEKGTWRRR